MITHRMILIDPKARTIEEVQATSKHDDLVAMVGADNIDSFTIADYDRFMDVGLVDELGLAREEPVHAFRFKPREDPIAGKCLIFGARKNGGATCDASFPLSVLRSEIIWLGLIVPKLNVISEKNTVRCVVTWSMVS